MKAFLKSSEIKKILIRRHISQNYFAILIGTSSGYISHLMTGKRNPSPKMRRKILKALKGNKFDDIFEIQNN